MAYLFAILLIGSPSLMLRRGVRGNEMHGEPAVANVSHLDMS